MASPPAPGDQSLPASVAGPSGRVVKTERLGHGGRLVGAVLRHHVQADHNDDLPGAVIEKRLLPGVLRGPAAELLFYRNIAPSVRLTPLEVPELLAAERVGREDHLILEALSGKHPGLVSVLEEVGTGIAALELSSSRWLSSLSAEDRKTHASLEFFAGGPFARGYRGFYLRYLAMLLCRRQPPVDRRRLLTLGRRLVSLERQVRKDQACLCHLDISGKNLIRAGERLFLIDWGQVAIGRPGFDLGTTLAQIARRRSGKVYRSSRRSLLRAYARPMKREAPELLQASRRGRAFYLACTLLFHMAHRPDTTKGPWFLACMEAELARAIPKPDRIQRDRADSRALL